MAAPCQEAAGLQASFPLPLVQLPAASRVSFPPPAAPASRRLPGQLPAAFPCRYEVARAMAGFTGADCMGLMQRAARMAARQGRWVAWRCGEGGGGCIGLMQRAARLAARQGRSGLFPGHAVLPS